MMSTTAVYDRKDEVPVAINVIETANRISSRHHAIREISSVKLLKDYTHILRSRQRAVTASPASGLRIDMSQRLSWAPSPKLHPPTPSRDHSSPALTP